MTTGLGQVDSTKTSDHYDLDDIDVGAPARVCYVVPAQAAGIIKVTLSMKMLPFRSTTNLNPSTVGTDATGSSGHSHSHAHSFVLDNNTSGTAVVFGGAPTRIATGGGGTDSTGIQSNAVGESGHSHSHSHTLTGTNQQAVTDGRIGVINSILVDGIDKTTILGGPWSGDIVEMDVSSVFAKAPMVWHVITLVPDGLTRAVTLLRIYYTT